MLAIAFFIVAAILTKHHARTWNTSRMATIDALAVHHTFALDDIETYATGDTYRFDGKFYSDKPPLLAIAGAAVAVVARPFGIDMERTPKLAYCTLLLVGTSYAAGLVALFSTLRLAASNVWSAGVTVVAGLATLLLPQATVLGNHVVAGALVAMAFRLLVSPNASRRTIALAGVVMATAAAVDIAFTVVRPNLHLLASGHRALAKILGTALGAIATTCVVGMLVAQVPRSPERGVRFEARATT